ncbi:MAG: hypothetical protein NUV98_02990 [Candidatus Roizmanbacteria bacterium]|nr:hypothetical protein [Candidatus Roizmanbacteria bacterium]
MNDDIKPPVGTDAGQGDKGDAHSQSFQIPDNLKGKSAEELAKMYVEAEKKMGEHSSEVAEARKKVDEALKLQTDAAKARETLQELTELIYDDPERIKAVEGWYAKKTGKSLDQNKDGKDSPSDSSASLSQNQPMVDDTRSALQDQIFDEFYERHGIDKLPQKEKQEALQKISFEFADLFDLSGKKTISQIVSGRPLKSLRRDLEKAFRLSNIGESSQGDEPNSNDQAAIGSLSGKTIREDSDKLTAQEEQMAKNLGISPDKYLERKKQIAKERASVS